MPPPPVELDIRGGVIRITDIQWETKPQLPQPAKPHWLLDHTE
ncbi:hypothetical protein OHU23_40690 (plasmid) [Streptomyces virginiae]